MGKKGGQFERDMCRRLSEWWTGGERDDVFWRTSGSGARASRRAKKGKKTYGQDGDIQATDPIGQPLLDVVTIELKRGTNRAGCSDILDQPLRRSPIVKDIVLHETPWEVFIRQAKTQAEQAETPHWMLIHKRDLRNVVVYYSFELHTQLQDRGNLWWPLRPLFRIRTMDGDEIVGLALENFLEFVHPDRFLKIHGNLK